MVKVIVGVGIVLGAIFLFGPMVLLMLIPMVLLAAWIFSPSTMTEEQKKAHNQEMNDAFLTFFGRRK